MLLGVEANLFACAVNVPVGKQDRIRPTLHRFGHRLWQVVVVAGVSAVDRIIETLLRDVTNDDATNPTITKPIYRRKELRPQRQHRVVLATKPAAQLGLGVDFLNLKSPLYDQRRESRGRVKHVGFKTVLITVESIYVFHDFRKRASHGERIGIHVVDAFLFFNRLKDGACKPARKR